MSAASSARSLLEAGKAAIDAGAVEAGIECLRRASADAEQAAELELAAEVLVALGVTLVRRVRGYDDEGALVLQSAARLAAEAGANALVADARRELGYIDSLAGRRSSAQGHLRAAREAAGDDQRLLAAIDGVEGLNLTDWGRLDAALEALDTAVELGDRIGDLRQLAWTLAMGARTRLLVGDISGGHAWAARAVRLTEAERLTSFRPWPVAIRSEAELLDGGDPDDLLPVLEESFALSCQIGDPCWESASARAMALVLDAKGDRDAALEWVATA